LIVQEHGEFLVIVSSCHDAIRVPNSAILSCSNWAQTH
jgi:hypothetical protein